VLHVPFPPTQRSLVTLFPSQVSDSPSVGCRHLFFRFPVFSAGTASSYGSARTSVFLLVLRRGFFFVRRAGVIFFCFRGNDRRFLSRVAPPFFLCIEDVLPVASRTLSRGVEMADASFSEDLRKQALLLFSPKVLGGLPPLRGPRAQPVLPFPCVQDSGRPPFRFRACVFPVFFSHGRSSLSFFHCDRRIGFFFLVRWHGCLFFFMPRPGLRFSPSPSSTNVLLEIQ